MSMFEKIGRHITDAGRKSAQNTRAASQKLKLGSAISDKERKLNQLYISLGQNCYRRSMEDPAEADTPETGEITRLLAEIRSDKNQIEQINETKNVFVPASDDANRKTGIIAVAALALALVVAVIYLFGGRSCSAAVGQYVNAQFGTDAEEILDLIPEDMIEYALEDSGYGADELDEFIDELTTALQKQQEQLNKTLGEDWKCTYEILETKNITGDELDALVDFYADMDVKVSGARTVEIEFTISAEDTEISNPLVVSAIKVGRSWYLDIASMGGLF